MRSAVIAPRHCAFHAIAVVFATLGFVIACGALSLVRAQSLDAVLSGNQGHDTAEWTEVAAHLPDPATASAERLELAGDVLRARRFHADALAFYKAAMTRGADPRLVFKKMGIVCLEMQQPRLARLLFGRVVRLNKRDGVAWNDMAAADMASGESRAAIGEYRHAVRLENNNAVFHSNLAMAYFEVHAPENARRELQTALRLNPDILHRTDGSGYSAQLLSAEHFAELCLEMAHASAERGDVPELLEWLSKASERGLALRDAMQRDALLRPWLADPRVGVMLRNRELLRASKEAPMAVPSLGAAPQD